MFIRTRRLLLRPIYPEDAGEIHAGIAHEDVVRMLARAPWPYLPEHAAAFCAAQSVDPLALQFAIALPGERGAPVIGGIGIDMAGDVPELGYWIAPAHQRQSFAPEAVEAVLDAAALLGHDRIEAGHFHDNPASGAVLIASGFAPTGIWRDTACAGRGGEMVPTLRYGHDLTQRRWWERRAA